MERGAQTGEQAVERESMEYDVVIVGGGPSGLACAIRLKQLAAESGRELSVCLLEKGSEIGAHILSGAVLEPRALNELIPDWKQKGAPVETPAREDRVLFLTERKAYPLPVPPFFRNHGNYVISLGNLCRWLGKQAEELGVEIYAGFAAAEVLYREDGSVKGVATGDMGVAKDGTHTGSFQRGVELHAKQTVFAEGCRGSLTKTLFKRFSLREGVDPQTYGIGIKELWEAPAGKHRPGLVIHTIGWPLASDTYGGSFLYHFGENLISVGFVVGLDYRNPHLSPFDEFQRFKTHPEIRPFLAGGRRIAYGARALSEGGFQSIPKLTFPGGMLVGDTAGFLNVPKIKGSHLAMKSGMTAAEAVFEALAGGAQGEVTGYAEKLKRTWLWDELHRARNIRPSFYQGLWAGVIYAGIDQYVFQGKAPWTFRIHADHTQLGKASEYPRVDYPKPDGVRELRQALVGLSFGDEPRGKPAEPPDARGRVGADRREPRALRRARAALLPGRRVRDRARPGRPQSAAPDQRPELRALQDLRHQGPDPEHQLGRPAGRRRTELPEHVSRGRTGIPL